MAIFPHTYASTVWLQASTRIRRRECVPSSPQEYAISTPSCKDSLLSTVFIGTIAPAPVSKTGMAAANSTETIGPVDALIPQVPHGNANALRLIQADWPVQTATVDLSFQMFNMRHANEWAMWQNTVTFLPRPFASNAT